MQACNWQSGLIEHAEQELQLTPQLTRKFHMIAATKEMHWINNLPDLSKICRQELQQYGLSFKRAKFENKKRQKLKWHAHSREAGDTYNILGSVT